jgi:hypothetical protein
MRLHLWNYKIPGYIGPDDISSPATFINIGVYSEELGIFHNDELIGHRRFRLLAKWGT